MTLYEMTEQARALYAMLTQELPEDEEGRAELTQIISDTMESIGAEDKLESYAVIINQLKADREMLKAEEDRLARKRKTIENNLDSMKYAIGNYMDAIGKEKESAGTFTVSFRKSKAVNIVDEEKIPDEFKEIETKVKISKAEISKALKEGINIPGAELIENRSVMIK